MEKDILYYMTLMYDNILLVEADKTNKDALNIIEDSFRHIFEDIKLFLISKKDRYYGYFLININLEINFKKDIIAGVSIDSNPFIIIVNPLLLGKYKLREIIYIICHEIEHLVFNHPTEMVRMNPKKNSDIHKKLNIAMDAAVNDMLNEYINNEIMLIPKDIITSRTISELTKKNVAYCQDYAYYYELIGNIEINNQKELLISEMFENNMKRNQSEHNNSDIITANDSNGNKDHIWTNSDDYHEVSGEIKEFVKEVYDGIPEFSRGLLPAYQIDAINKILAPAKIKWQNVLKKYIGLIPIPYKKTKTRLNRRQPERFDISGRINDRTIRVVVAIDTSGSMSNKMLEYIFTEIFDILKHIKFELTVIECDADIGRVYKAKKISDINMEVTGRGGTSFTPVIEYINKNNYRDALLIYFTDGFGDDEIPKPKTYRNIWVVFNDINNLSVKNPHGIVIPLECDDINNWW